MTPNCLLLDNQSETFLVQIMIYEKLDGDTNYRWELGKR